MLKGRGISKRSLALLVGVFALLFPASAGAAVVTPNTTADEYDSVTPNLTCSLREAIKSADQDSDFGGCTHTGGSYLFLDPDTVLVPGGTYTLTIPPSGGDVEDSGDLNTFSNMTIEAAPGVAVTVDATGNNDRILAASVLGVTVTLRGLTLTGGSPAGSGGAIFTSSGTGLVVTDSTITGNTAAGSGGGIAANGPTSLTGVAVTGNNATLNGGGVALQSNGSLTVGGASHLDGNGSDDTGGGISQLSDGNITLNPGVTVDGNSAVGFGGGVYVMGNGTLTVDGASISDNDLTEESTFQRAIGSGISFQSSSAFDITGAQITGNDALGDNAIAAMEMISGVPSTIERSTISNNTATGQDDADGDVVGPAAIRLNDNAGVTIADSTISENTVTGPDNQDIVDGGAIYTLSPLTITGSTLALNSIASSASAAGGAAVYTDGPNAPTEILNSTFTGNDGDEFGGAINVQQFGDLTIGQSTFSGNVAPQGSAINTQGGVGSEVTLRGTIFVQGGTACSFGGSQTLNEDAFNVEDGTSCLGASGDTDFENTMASLGALADNGGPTMTKALLGPTLLFNAADTCTQLDGTTPLLVDQRGAPRPTEGACEPGAYERFFCDGVLFNGPGPIACPPPPGGTTGGGTTQPGTTGTVFDPCPPLRKKLRRAKRKLRAATKAGEPTADLQRKVKKLKKKLKRLGC
jgi:CSLREA domain-containing protein